MTTVEPRLTATAVIRSPRYYGHFFQPGKTAIHFLIKNPGECGHPLIRLHFKIPNSRISYNFTLLIWALVRSLENQSACDMSILLT